MRTERKPVCRRMNGVRRLPLLMLVAIAAGPLAATTFVLEHEGIRVDGEICRYPALDRVNPFERWLASPDVTCTPSGSPVEFPRGLWDVFARSGSTLVSVEALLIDGNAPPASLSIPLRPAAGIDVSLPAGKRVVVYTPRHAAAFPIADVHGVVPAEEELWLFVVEKSKPVALVPVAAVPPGEVRRVDARIAPQAIIGWMQVPDSDRNAIAGATGMLLPAVRAVSSVVAREADALSPLPLLHGAFFRIANVAPGFVDVRLEGRGYIRTSQQVRVEPAITIVRQPLSVRVAGTLTVHWSTREDLEALDRSLGACGAERASGGEITVSSCKPPRPREEVDPAACTLVRTEPFEPSSRLGSFTIDELAPGFYRAELRYGKLPPIGATGSVVPLAVRDVWLGVGYSEMEGSLTYGGEPIQKDVKIEFHGGYGFAPRESDEYRAVRRVLADADARLDINACDGSLRAVVLTDEPMQPHTRFDIDIPDNELTVEVSDTFTRERLRGATVRYQVMSLRRPPRVVLEGKWVTAEEGRVVQKSVPPRELRLTVTFPGYEKKIVEPFSLTRSETRTVEVQLMPLRGNHGKIRSNQPFDNGSVAWFSPGGSETERVELAVDGTFIYSNWHTADETMCVVSSSHPLWVLRSPAVERRETIELRYPDAPSRSFDLSLATTDPRSWFVAIVVGGVRIPQPVLTQHQLLRREASVVRAAAAMHVRDILVIGAIDVILGPSVEEVPGRVRAMDFFALPQYANLPRERLGPDATTMVLNF